MTKVMTEEAVEKKRLAMARKWKKLANREVMGWEPANRAYDIYTFFEDLEYFCPDSWGPENASYGTHTFGRYVESALRGYKISHGLDGDELYLSTTLDLHSVSIAPWVLVDFEKYLSKKWEFYFDFARSQGIYGRKK